MLKIVIFCSLLGLILSDITCDEGEYLTTATTKTCQGCPANCTKCSSATVCTGCISGYFLYTNAGKTICEKNESLTSNCAASTDKTTCTACASGFFLNSKNNCTAATFGAKCAEWEKADTETCKTAAAGYYLKDGTPTACSANCNACSATACTACKTGYYLLANSTCKATTALCKTWVK